ncbi:MAG: extracellular solute-binding protein [Nitrospiraceae bacterium]|nr:extracellular solute-binding protein [Nitrospiraceae bacterium]
MRYSRSIVVACLALAFLCGCSGTQENEAPSESAPENSGAVIRVDLNLYTPGTIPQGIGDPVNVSQELADEWHAKRGGPKIKYQILVNTGSSEGEWLKTQLVGGIAPEIVSLNAEVVWPDVDKGWFVPLDEFLERPNPYAPGNEHWLDLFSNQALMGAKRAPDGKLYCISIDIVETGIFYNKGLLEKAGVTSIPQTWAEMDDALGKLAELGVTPMTSAGNLASDWGQDIIFEMLYRDILPRMDVIPSRADAEGYLGHYLEASEAGFLFTKGFFTRRDPRWREMNRILKEWRRHWARELKNSDPVRLFLTGRLGMFWDGSWFIRRIATDPYVDFEWGVTYIPTLTKATSRFGSGTPATVIGGAAIQLHVTNSANLNGNLEDCIDYLMYLTAPQNIERMTSEALVFIPNIKGARMDERLAPFGDIFRRQYCAIKWLESMDGKYKKYWRRMLDYYLNDGVELDEFLAMLEDNFAGWVQSHREEEGWDFDLMEKAWAQNAEALSRELEPVS